jgi:hypothetical protein
LHGPKTSMKVGKSRSGLNNGVSQVEEEIERIEQISKLRKIAEGRASAKKVDIGIAGTNRANDTLGNRKHAR